MSKKPKADEKFWAEKPGNIGKPVKWLCVAPGLAVEDRVISKVFRLYKNAEVDAVTICDREALRVTVKREGGSSELVLYLTEIEDLVLRPDVDRAKAAPRPKRVPAYEEFRVA